MFLLVIGGILSALAIALGAYIRHAAAPTLSTAQISSLLTALEYHKHYALVLVILGLVLLFNGPKTRLLLFNISGFLFCLGLTLFSFSIYTSWLLDRKTWLFLAPWGGFSFIAGWIVLVWAGVDYYLKAKKR